MCVGSWIDQKMNSLLKSKKQKKKQPEPIRTLHYKCMVPNYFSQAKYVFIGVLYICVYLYYIFMGDK
jgi:hypothetical protein